MPLPRQASLAGAPEIKFQRSGFFWRFNLHVSHLLHHHEWPVERLLREPWPDQAGLEAEIRAGRSVAHFRSRVVR